MKREYGKTLIGLARYAIAGHLGLPYALPAGSKAEWLHEQRACFVTLTLDGQLRGCIGTLEAHRPLIEDLRANAIAAASHDPRFPALSADEFEQISIEVSLLSAATELSFTDEADAMARIRPGIDGVIFEYDGHRSTFLPQVWEQLPDPVQFIAHLKMKAGLPSDFWHPDLRLSTYRVDKFSEVK